jgi:hypothetical protein
VAHASENMTRAAEESEHITEENENLIIPSEQPEVNNEELDDSPQYPPSIITSLSILSIWQICSLNLSRLGSRQGLSLALIYFTSLCQLFIALWIMKTLCSYSNNLERFKVQMMQDMNFLRARIATNVLLVVVVGFDYKELCKMFQYDITVIFILVLLVIDTLSALKYFTAVNETINSDRLQRTMEMRFKSVTEMFYLAFLSALVYFCLRDKTNKGLKYSVIGPLIMLLYKGSRWYCGERIKQFENYRLLVICLMMYCCWTTSVTFLSFRSSCFRAFAGSL